MNTRNPKFGQEHLNVNQALNLFQENVTNWWERNQFFKKDAKNYYKKFKFDLYQKLI